LRRLQEMTGEDGHPMTKAEAGRSSTIERYLAEINRYPLLTVGEEQDLARAFRTKADGRAAHLLVTSNLRFVVKVAYEYRSYGFRVADLVQEGNIGLMKAVQKFDPDKGIRLISYAVWWIRAYIQNYILKSWSMVKLGTTQAQRKLFFSLARTRRELDRASAADGAAPSTTAEQIAAKLRVKTEEVQEMQIRMEGRDLSLDAPVGDDGTTTHVEHVPDASPGQDDELSGAQQSRVVAGRIAEALARLDVRERFIIEARLMNDQPMTLKDLGDHFGFSRERARQLEIRAKEKLRTELEQLAAEVDWPTDGKPVELEETV
jgi:RNA polymerase sigma-32 factor